MENIKEIFSFNLKRLIDEDGRILDKIAESCEISKSFLNSLKAGNTWASPETIESLCKGLKCSPSDLFLTKDELVAPRLELILKIHSVLSTLNYDELRVALSAVESLAPKAPRSKSKATIAD